MGDTEGVFYFLIIQGMDLVDGRMSLMPEKFYIDS